MSTAAATDKQVSYIHGLADRIYASELRQPVSTSSDPHRVAMAAQRRAMDADRAVGHDGAAQRRVYAGTLAQWMRDNLGQDTIAEMADPAFGWISQPFGIWVRQTRPELVESVVASYTSKTADATTSSLWAEWIGILAGLLDHSHIPADRAEASVLIDILN